MSLRVLLPGSTIPSKLLKVVPTQLGSEVVLELGGSECRSLSNDFQKRIWRNSSGCVTNELHQNSQQAY